MLQVPRCFPSPGGELYPVGGVFSLVNGGSDQGSAHDAGGLLLASGGLFLASGGLFLAIGGLFPYTRGISLGTRGMQALKGEHLLIHWGAALGCYGTIVTLWYEYTVYIVIGY